jgi:DNA-directed RNA polymerase subunit RPC12/RpoP
MEFLKTYVYDHRIARTIKEDSADSVQWNIEEVKPDNECPDCKYQLAFKIKNKKYYVKTISYTVYVNPDIKQYQISAIEHFMADVEKELPNVNFSIKFNTKNKEALILSPPKEEKDFSVLGWNVGDVNKELDNKPKAKKMRL